MKRSLTLVPALLAPLIWAITPLPLAAAGLMVTSVNLPSPTEFCTEEFQISTTQISPVEVNFGIDYEFDQVNYRAEWQRAKTLRVIDFNPNTGLPVGTPVVVDTGIATTWPAAGDFLFGGNGAEWAYSARGSELFYMKPHGRHGGNRQLMKAYETSPGEWATEPLPNGVTRGFPIGSRDPSDPVPRIFYMKQATEQTTFTYDGAIREVPEDPETEWGIPAPVTIGEGGPRWVPGKRQIVLSLLDETDVEQVAIYDLDTREFDMVTDYTAADGIDIDETWASALPALGPDAIVVWFLVNNTEFRFYLKDITDSWVLANAVNPAQAVGNLAMPYVLSPEACSFEDRSYIIFQLSVTKNRQHKPGEIYLMMPGSYASCHFRLLSSGDGRVRKAPECLALRQKMAAYFVEWDDNDRSGLYLAETGLR